MRPRDVPGYILREIYKGKKREMRKARKGNNGSMHHALEHMKLVLSIYFIS